MRTKIAYVLLVATVGIFSRCVWTEQEVLYVEGSPLSFPGWASSKFSEKVFYVNTNVSNWQVNCNETWCNFTKNDNTVTVSVTENTTKSSRTAIITVSAGNLSNFVNVVQTADQTKVNGVVINGVCWATCNVDRPGTFTTRPEDAGMLYQMNRKMGWSSTDPIINSNGGTTWDSTPDSYWEKTNDPSPVGWHLPTSTEISSLDDTENVANEWTPVNGKNGIKFTDKTTGNSIFFPAVGYRSSNDSYLRNVNTQGFYWSTTSVNLTIESTRVYCASFGLTGYAYSIRSVADY